MRFKSTFIALFTSIVASTGGTAALSASVGAAPLATCSITFDGTSLPCYGIATLGDRRAPTGLSILMDRQGDTVIRITGASSKREGASVEFAASRKVLVFQNHEVAGHTIQGACFIAMDDDGIRSATCGATVTAIKDPIELTFYQNNAATPVTVSSARTSTVADVQAEQQGALPLIVGDYDDSTHGICGSQFHYWSNRMGSGLFIGDEKSPIYGDNCSINGAVAHQSKTDIVATCSQGHNPERTRRFSMKVITTHSFLYRNVVYTYCGRDPNLAQ